MILFRKKKKQEEQEQAMVDPFLLYTRQRQAQSSSLPFLPESRQETASSLVDSVIGYGSKRRTVTSSEVAFCSDESSESC